MKAKGIPDKIYLQVCGSCEQKYCDACEFEDLEDGITWSKDKIFPNDIEYIRADAFIEKACDWLDNNLQGIVGGSIYVEDFKRYMRNSYGKDYSISIQSQT